MHSNEMEDVDKVHAGEICAIFGVDCHTGTTFIHPTALKTHNYSMTSMHVPDPVISLAIAPKTRGNTNALGQFGKALARFQKEDPTFRIHTDPENNETIMSGMGELHLEIYKERLEREYGVECVMGNPKVNYRETATQRAQFEYLHKKQTGGSGQYAKVMGYIEPIPEEERGEILGGGRLEFINALSGNNIPPEFVPAIEKGFAEGTEDGPLTGSKVEWLRFVIEDGQSHAVDSSELAFKTATKAALKEAMKTAGAQILEPIMSVTVEIPQEFQGNVVGALNRRKAMVENIEARGSDFCVINAAVPLTEMFGYASELRSGTEGKGEFSMEYREHQPVTQMEQERLEAEYIAARKAAQN